MAIRTADLPNNRRDVDKLECVEGERTYFRSTAVRGLYLDVMPKGARTWRLRYQVTKGGQRIFRAFKIGDATAIPIGQAISKAREVLASVQVDGRDPVGEAKRKNDVTVTMSDLFKKWLNGHAKKKLATWDMEERRYNRHLAKPIGKVSFVDIERQLISEIRDEVAEKSGEIESNRVVALFNRVANFAVDEGYAKFNPAARLRKVGTERRRERVLSDDELRRLWTELEKPLSIDHTTGGLTGLDIAASVSMRRAIKLLVLLGQRRTETIGMFKSEIDYAAKIWTIPPQRIEGDHTSGGTKNRLPHRLPLTPAACAVLKQCFEAAGASPFVFPSHKTDAAMRGDAVTTALRRLCKKLDKPILGIGPHDLRRTVGTNMRKLGVSVEDRAHVFNHISGAKSKVTSWNYDAGDHDKEKLEALLKWEQQLLRIVNPTSSD